MQWLRSLREDELGRPESSGIREAQIANEAEFVQVGAAGDNWKGLQAKLATVAGVVYSREPGRPR
jgi:hypothetical protein